MLRDCCVMGNGVGVDDVCQIELATMALIPSITGRLESSMSTVSQKFM